METRRPELRKGRGRQSEAEGEGVVGAVGRRFRATLRPPTLRQESLKHQSLGGGEQLRARAARELVYITQRSSAFQPPGWLRCVVPRRSAGPETPAGGGGGRDKDPSFLAAGGEDVNLGEEA